MTSSASQPLEAIVRPLAPVVLSAVMRRVNDFSLAEDAVQESLMAAFVQWPKDGVPHDAKAWLIKVALRRLTDVIRSEAARRKREAYVVSLISFEDQMVLPPDEQTYDDKDDSLTLLFMCCHPCLSNSSAIALTLRALGGLTTAEIAAAFFVPESTMAQRISRAKQQLKETQMPFSLPTPDDIPNRLTNVLHVLYLIFNEGYSVTAGESLYRTDLSHEAIRLTRALYLLTPNFPEVGGLLALMLFTDARRRARMGALGEVIPLDQQDRKLWDQSQIAEATELLTQTLPMGAVGQYQIQAAIAALHDEAKSIDETDWVQILALYNLLLQITDNPAVALSRAVAVAMVHGVEKGLECLQSLEKDPRIGRTHRLIAVRAHLRERQGNYELAIDDYQCASEQTASNAEQLYLRMQAARLRDKLPH